jgi:hypothetical protein
VQCLNRTTKYCLHNLLYMFPVSGNGMAAMTNGDKGEEVCNALRQRVATAYGWR